jgi:hypothetical protein
MVARITAITCGCSLEMNCAIVRGACHFSFSSAPAGRRLEQPLHDLRAARLAQRLAQHLLQVLELGLGRRGGQARPLLAAGEVLVDDAFHVLRRHVLELGHEARDGAHLLFAELLEHLGRGVLSQGEEQDRGLARSAEAG